MFFFFFKQKTAYELRISDWSSDVCSSDLLPSDHKFHVFGGRVEFIIMYIGRGTDMRAQMFDREWNKLNCRYYRDPPDSIPPRPKCLPQMIEMAEALGKDFCFVRVDLYEIGRAHV